MDNRRVPAAIDQLLFGYRDGHELLAGSLEINARLQADLLPHADARFDDESDHYIVGLRVEALGRFMLTRIWPAPELPRPGAVWAHALLIDDAAVELIDPLLLIKHFRRPELDEFDSYCASFDLPTTGLSQCAEVSDELMTALCQVAYEGGEGQAVVIWPDEVPSEIGLLALWRRLPSAVRRRYSFRSRGRARTGSSPYAVQVASLLAGRSVSQSVRVLWPAELDPSLPVTLLADASRDPAHPLNAMLDEFAFDVADSLAIAELWPLVAKPDPSAVLERLGKIEQDSLVPRLTSALFGPCGSHGSWWDLGEDRRLIALLESQAPLARSLVDRARLQVAWGQDHETMLTLLDKRETLPAQSAERLVESALNALGLEELLARAEDSELISRALDARADLLRHPEFWVALEASGNLELGDLALSQAGTEAVPLLIETRSWKLLDHALSDPKLLAFSLDQIAERSPTDTALWHKILNSHGPDVAQVLVSKKNLSTAVITLAAVELRQSLLDQVPARRWVAAAPFIHDREDDVALVAAARLIAWTMRQKKPSRELLIECFGPAHRAIETRRLPERTRKELDRALPHPKMNSLSKRLSRILVESMESADWSETELRRALEPAGPEVQRMIKHVPKKHPARRLVEGALRDVESMLPFQ